LTIPKALRVPTYHTKSSLLELLDELTIAQSTIEHPPLHTVEEAQKWRGDLPGGFCKNLFLKDKKGALWLIVTLETRQIRLNQLPKALGSARLTFAKPELLWEVLGVRPGSVTPFAIANDLTQKCQIVLDEPMLAHQKLNYHPLTNEATTTISNDDLLKFIRHCGHKPIIIDLEAASGV
jgi:Ala-tRNA(Pro) deacylase